MKQAYYGNYDVRREKWNPTINLGPNELKLHLG